MTKPGRRVPLYREFAAPPSLAQDVRRLWTFEGDFEHDHDERIAPDGCPELIFHFGDRYRERSGDGPWRLQPTAFLAGNLTRPLVLRAYGRVGVLGVRLWPDAVVRFTHLAPDQTLDRRIAFRGSDLAALAAVVGALCESATAARVRAAASAAVAIVRRKDVATDVQVARAVRAIFDGGGQVSLDTLATDCALSQRQFERRMRAATGLSPKLLASIVRFRAVFDALQADVPSPWLEAALASGYFDQAHMIRAFRRFAGQPPRAYLHSAGVLSVALVATGPGRVQA